MYPRAWESITAFAGADILARQPSEKFVSIDKPIRMPEV